MLYVLLGTYMSHNEDVRRAGLIADSNALALAVAVILLLTSRSTFNQATDSIKLEAWANLILDSPGDACASLNQRPFAGNTTYQIHFHCEDGRPGPGSKPGRTSLPLNASNQRQVMPFLKGMHDDCEAFAMAMVLNYTDGHTTMCYAPEEDIWELLIDEEGRHTNAEAEGIYRWKRLDWISPSTISTCEESFGAIDLQLAVNHSTCYYPANASRGIANNMGFPQGMGMVRWLDEVNKGLFLGLKCNSSMWQNKAKFDNCICSSKTVHSARGQWEVNGSDAPLLGVEKGSFCAPDGKLRLQAWPRYPYRCSNGAQSSSIQVLADEREALSAGQRFFYFRCLTYDELYAVYVGIIGVLIAVALTTTTLFFTDVARPMVLAGKMAWAWDFKGDSADEVSSEDTDGLEQYVLEGNTLDVVLRCAAACVVGSVLGIGCMYVPWRVALETNQGQACNSAY